MNQLHACSRIVALLMVLAVLVSLMWPPDVQAGGDQGSNRPVVVRFEDDGEGEDDEEEDAFGNGTSGVEIDDDAPAAPAGAPSAPVSGDDDDFEQDDDDAEQGDFDGDGGGNGAGNATSGNTTGVRSGEIVDDDGDATTSGYFDGEAIIRLASGVAIDEFNARHGTHTIAGIDGRDLYLVQLPADYDHALVDAEMAAHGDTVWAELNYASEAPEGRPGYFFTSSAPDATGAGDQYALDVLGVDAARACASGSGVVVAVLDTGVDAMHPALRGRVLTTGVNILAGTDDTSDRGNDVDDDADGTVDEMVGHGTHVAGIVAQIAPGATILPITVLNSDGIGDAFYLAGGIYEAVARGADVINLSLGSTHNAIIVEEAIAEALAAGVTVVAAAGNAGREEPAEYPAAFPLTIGVASTGDGDRKSEFSNYGPAVTIAAPGEEIVSAVPGGALEAWGGTSMATAFVAGAAALVIGGNPDLPSEQVHDRLVSTAEDISAANPELDGKLGAGRLDVAAAAGCP
ncbi:MAG: S8 family serine peptidase [Thermomicrobiales bacterium]